MKLYRKRYKEMIKLAGTQLPKDPKMWPSEILKTLVTEHPYVDTASTKVTFSKVEPESKESIGKIIIDNKVAIPFSIRENAKTKKLELDNLDIVFDGNMFMHLNENSLQRALDSESNIDIHGKKDYGSLPPQNRYIGDRTGDVTPLEFSGHPTAASGGAMMNTAGSGLLSRIVRSDNDIRAISNFLATHSGINSIAESVGLNDSFDQLKDGLVEGLDNKRLAHIMKRRDGSFAVAFENGDTRVASIDDIKSALGPDFKSCMRQVMQRGWCMIREFPVLKSVEQPIVNLTPGKIDHGGRYRLVTPTGQSITGHVFADMIDFDGSRIKRQKVILDDGSFTEGKAIVGTRINSDDSTFPIGLIRTGVKGCFIDESFSMSCTPNVVIEKIISMPGEPDIYIGQRTDVGTPIGLMVVSGISRPHKVRQGDYDPALMPLESYYMPDHMSFAEVGEKVNLVDRASIQALQKTAEKKRPKATLKKNANMYFLFGNTNNGPVNSQMMTEEDMRTKIASFRADDYVIEKACEMDDGESMDLFGLTRGVTLKTASKKKIKTDGRLLRRIKIAADEAAEGMDEAAKTENPVDDSKTLDAILSLQLINDDTLEEIVESEDLFVEVEDKLAKLLLASRQGEAAVHEKGVEKALKGIGEARKSIAALRIELEDRNV